MRTNYLLRMALCASLTAMTGIASATIPSEERAALDAFYTQTHGASWTVNTGWEGAVGTECTWQGIGCTDTGLHVAIIQLDNNNLQGTLPDLSALNSLQIVDVQGNQLSGAVPSLAELVHLRVFLVANNHLSGAVPIPPSGDSLQTAASSLCPNNFIPVSNPQTATDRIWDDATDNDPWSEGCSGAVVGAPAVPIPTLGFDSLLAMASVLGGIGFFARRRRPR